MADAIAKGTGERAGQNGGGRKCGEVDSGRRHPVGCGVQRDEARDAAVTERVEKKGQRDAEHPPFDKIDVKERSIDRLAHADFLQPDRNQRHRKIQQPGADAHGDPAELIDPQPNGRGNRDRQNRRHTVIADSFAAPVRGDEIGQIGRRRGHERRPEHAVHEHHSEKHPHGRDKGICCREHGNGEARDDQNAPFAETVRKRAGEWGAQCRRVGEEPEEQAGGKLAPAQRQDAERRRRQELKRREEHGEGEPAHDEEAGREETSLDHRHKKNRVYPPTCVARISRPVNVSDVHEMRTR